VNTANITRAGGSPTAIMEHKIVLAPSDLDAVSSYMHMEVKYSYVHRMTGDKIKKCICKEFDRLCGLVDRVLGYRFPALPKKKSSGSGTGSTQLVSTTEELLDRKVAAPV
jgi:hypothetical protein